MSVSVTLTDQWSDGKRLHVIGYLQFSGSYTTGGDAVSFGSVANDISHYANQGGVRSSGPPEIFLTKRLAGYDFLHQPGLDNNYTPPVPSDNSGLIQIFYGGTASVAATGTITDGNTTNVSNNDTVTIGSTTYTFVTALSGTLQILIGTNADTSLTNLVQAINASGTPGTNYSADITTANTQVTASTVASHATTLTAAAGAAGNSIALSTTSSHLTVSGADLSGGVSANSGGKELPSGTYPTDITGLASNPAKIGFYAIWLQFQ